MIRFAILIILLINFALSNTQNLFNKVTYIKLKNGMQVYLLDDNKSENTNISVSVKVGWADENKSNYGLSHLVEHLIFRDKNVSFRDYYDYLIKNGATNVNGITSRYTTKYYATIDANKSYWLLEQFHNMLSKMNIDKTDLKVEKGAVQNEIGEPTWYVKLSLPIIHFFKYITPPNKDIYQTDFNIPKEKESIDNIYAQINNKKFTIKDVLKRYNNYYYPKNMTLKIVGNFDKTKMINLINKTFATIDKNGTKTVTKPKYTPKLIDKPTKLYDFEPDRCYASIGTKYIANTYKKYLIMSVYLEDLSHRLQRKLRNIDGKIYSIYSSNYGKYKAYIGTINFDSLHKDFNYNLNKTENFLNSDLNNLNDKKIKDAINYYKTQYYKSIEHDIDTLLYIVNEKEMLLNEYNTTKSSYQILNSITPKEFKDTINELFNPKHSYKYISRDYYIFPLDITIYIIILLTISIFIVRYLLKKYYQKRVPIFEKRDIRYKQRVSSRFFGFTIIFLTIIITLIIDSWVEYFISNWIFNTQDAEKIFDIPYVFLYYILSIFIFISIYALIYITLWRYFAYIAVAKDNLYFVGNKIEYIPLNSIKSLEVVPYKPNYFTKIIGTFFRFYKPLLKIETKDNKIFYIRSNNPSQLKDDLEKFINSNHS